MTSDYRRQLTLGGQRARPFGLSLIRDREETSGLFLSRPTLQDRGLAGPDLNVKPHNVPASVNPLVEAPPSRLNTPSVARPSRKLFPTLWREARKAAAHGEETSYSSVGKTAAQLDEFDQVRTRTSGGSADPPGTHTGNLPTFDVPP